MGYNTRLINLQLMIKELNKFEKELRAFRNQGALPQGEVKNALVDIYEANWEQNKRWGSSTINRTCPSCISDMMKSLAATWEKQFKVFKGIPVPAVLIEEVELDSEIGELYSDMPTEIDMEKVTHPAPTNGYHDLKWGELRKFATLQGVNTKGKNKATILAELDEIFK